MMLQNVYNMNVFTYTDRGSARLKKSFTIEDLKSEQKGLNS